MPIYTFECQSCKKEIDQWHKVTRIPTRVRCQCGRMAKRVLSMSGAIQTDGDVKWLPSARQVLQPDYEIRARPIETRGQYKKYLKEHGLICKG